MFGGGDRVAKRRVHDDHALLRSGRNFDVVNPDPGAANDFKVFGGVQQFFGDLGRRPDRQPVVVWDRGQKRVFVFAQFGPEIDVDPTVVKDLDGGFR